MASRAQQQLILLGVLGVIMVAVYARAFAPRSASTSPPAEEAQVVAAVPAGEPADTGGVTLLLPESSAKREAQRTRAARLAWSRDPFFRGGGASGTSGLTLSGILWDPTAPMAIVNGQPVHVGEEIEGYRVVEIGTDHVAVSDGAETFRLTTSP